MKKYEQGTVKKYVMILCLVAGFLFSQACSDPSRPVIPIENNVVTDISGEYNLKFEAPGNVVEFQSPEYISYNCQCQSNIKGTVYTLNIIIVYPDKQEKIGEFPFRQAKGAITQDCAFGNFEIGQGSGKKTFTSDSGKIILTKLDGQNVEGTFHFYATNTEGRRIEITNGVIRF